jgi:hypothetical protein
MNLQPVVLISEDIDAIFEFEMQTLIQDIPDEDERMLAQWKSPWRREALEHYLKLGWSMSMNDAAGKIQAYFLAQPILFMGCQTQTLWIEHLGGVSKEAQTYALEVAARLASDKHLQRVVIQGESVADGRLFTEADGLLKKARVLPGQIFEIRTTKG